APFLTITVELDARGRDEIHLHAGGQGVWVARMVARLDAPVALCAPLGGESGRVLRALIEAEGIELRAVACDRASGAYVHDRRGGTRRAIAQTDSPELSRHEADELYGVALTAGIEAGAAVLTGSAHPSGEPAAVLPHDAYRRLAGDLRRAGVTVVADLSGPQLAAALAGGVDLLKLSHRELLEAGYAEGDSPAQLAAGVRRLREAGGRTVLLSRAAEPALALIGHRLVEVVPPAFEPAESRGAGDSMTAGAAAGLARGLGLEDVVRLAAAAGALNVTRRGLGTGRRTEVERLLPHVELRDWAP
ncbi:MAG TPA: PfkB family carbohydrate kinase, partial [Thermodesulfobacteriota bacterium]|nr:PfkB family carbohydrate kinase [Thermodesulfobacteriota bacterium]